MVVALLTSELHFPANQSLKEKRILLQKLFARLKKNFNVSVAEVEYQNLWQRSRLAIACVNTSNREANATLTSAFNLIDEFPEVELIHHQFEIR